MSEAIVITSVDSISCDSKLGDFELKTKDLQRLERALNKAEKCLRECLAQPKVDTLFSVQTYPFQSIYFPERKTPIRLGNLAPVDLRKSHTNPKRKYQFWMGVVLARWAVPGYAMDAPSAVGAQLQVINLLCERVGIHQEEWFVKVHMAMGAGRTVFHYAEVISESQKVSCMNDLGNTGWEKKDLELKKKSGNDLGLGGGAWDPGGIWTWLFEEPPLVDGSSVLLVSRG